MAAVLVAACLSGCSSRPASQMPSATPAVDAYITAWSIGSWSAMQALVRQPPLDFTSYNSAAFTDLHVTKALFQSEGVTVKRVKASSPEGVSATATASLYGVLSLKDLGPVVVRTNLHLVLSGKHWYVEWSPSTIDPLLGPGDRFEVTYSWPARADILAADGAVLADEQTAADHPADLPLTPTLGLLGTITPAELRQMGAPYEAGDVVGQSGIEATFQAQLAGSPGATVAIVTADGSVAHVIATFKAKPGRPMVTSIVPSVQQAAESAFAGEDLEASFVAINTRTDQVEAVVNDNSGTFDLALDGQQPPGSTFKVITSTALFGDGLTPESAASCPKTIDVDGENLHNASGEQPVSDMLQAFTESCNTAFIGLAVAHLEAQSLHEAGAVYDLGTTPRLGAPAFGGSIPLDLGQTAIAESAIGQDQVVVSPLDLAMVAADIDSGLIREPRLVAGALDDRVPAGHLSSSTDSYLHEMMLSVVESGTASGTGLPPGTYAKTGTAEYGSGNPLPVDAWLMGFNGSTAFCAIVVNAPGDGGPTDGPLVAKFLDAIGS